MLNTCVSATIQRVMSETILTWKIIMITYEQWNKAIISYFFENCEPGEIVFLHTTPETLPEIAEQAGFDVDDAEESLKEAVRNKVICSDKVYLNQIDPNLSFNRSPDNEPMQVAFLALTVVAASKMESSEGASHTNYYIQLNKLLFDESIKGKPKGIKYEEWEDYWKHFQRWAYNQHEVQLYLTEGSSKKKYVWYPISQCLISNHDRRNVYQFFDKHHLMSLSEIQDKQLERDLRSWLQSSDGSVRINRYFSNESYRKSILSQVKLLHQHWDGEIPPAPIPGERQGYSSIRVELRFGSIGSDEIRYWFLRRGKNEISCRHNSLGIESLKTLNSEKWFRPETDKKNMFWNLSNSLRLQTDETKPIVYTLNRYDIWVFRVDQECDEGWLSRRNMHLNEDHIIVFRDKLKDQVIDCLTQTSQQEIETLNPVYVDRKENGWLYLQITPTKIKTFSDRILRRLSVEISKQITFSGGLSVKDQQNRRAYLDICLPTISVPDSGLSNEEHLQVNELAYPVDEDRCIKLDNALEPGVYQIKYGSKTRELRVISPHRSLAHKNKTLTAVLNKDQDKIPTYSEKTIAEIIKKSRVWVSGAMLYGTDIPKTTWEDVRIAPSCKDKNQSFRSPAHLISSIVQLAIKLKSNKVSVPDWFNEEMKIIDNNVALRVLVQKKLKQYKEIALSYENLRNYIGI